MGKANKVRPERRQAGRPPPLAGLLSHLTPKERQALFLVAGLFLLGFLVRWYRLAQLR